MRSFSALMLVIALSFPLTAEAGKKAEAELRERLEAQEATTVTLSARLDSMVREAELHGEQIKDLQERLDAAETRIGELEEQIGAIVPAGAPSSGPYRKDLSVTGFVDQAGLAQVLDNNKSRLTTCTAEAYEEALKSRKHAIAMKSEGATEANYPMPTRSTLMSVVVKVQPSGRVGNAEWVKDASTVSGERFVQPVTADTSPRDDGVDHCVESRLKDMHFPESMNGKAYTFTYWFK